MDKGRLAFLTIIAAAMMVAAAHAADTLPIRSMKWLKDTPDARLEALGRVPRPAISPDIQNNPQFAIGRALFQSPLLLGGQASKAGLACESCHQGGADNPHFLFQGMSGAAGTADVTNSFFSALRSNGTFDPAIIPDLTKPGKVSHDGKMLEGFIRNLIVEEFSGEEPDKDILSALAFYVRNLRGAELLAAQNMTLEQPLHNIDSAIRFAHDSAETGKTTLANALILSARHQLGLISERYTGSRLGSDRAALAKAGTSLGSISRLLETSPVKAAVMLQKWEKEFDRTRKNLKRHEPYSLYNQVRLKNMLEKAD